MTRAFVYEVRFLLGTENEYLLERVASSGERQGLPYMPNDVNWMALLSRQSSFRFLGRSGSLSVCLERSRSKDPTSRGDKPYWSAYRKAHGVQVKTYLGQDLTIGNLEAAAARVAARLKEKVGLSDEDLLLSSRTLSGKKKQQERMTHLLDHLQRNDQMMTDLRAATGNKGPDGSEPSAGASNERSGDDRSQAGACKKGPDHRQASRTSRVARQTEKATCKKIVIGWRVGVGLVPWMPLFRIEKPEKASLWMRIIKGR